jgi:uncharacterized repeat protein (TIGR02543 family)
MLAILPTIVLASSDGDLQPEGDQIIEQVVDDQSDQNGLDQSNPDQSNPGEANLGEANPDQSDPDGLLSDDSSDDSATTGDVSADDLLGEAGKTIADAVSSAGNQDKSNQTNLTSDEPADASLLPLASPEDLEPATEGITPLDLSDEGWIRYTGTYSLQMSSFAITINNNLTGWLGCAGGSYPRLYSASYYIRYNDGQRTADITYGYIRNSMSTSKFYVLVYNGSTFMYHDIGISEIESVWMKQVSPGYTALLLQGKYTGSGLNLDVRVTMTPNYKGTVQYDWQITNLGASNISVGAVFMIDTELEGEDYVPVYSAGTNNGMYIDKSNGFARVYFPIVAESAGGPYDYAAGNWAAAIDSWGKITAVFGSNLNIIKSRDVPHNVGDVLVTGVDSAVFFRYTPSSLLSGETRAFAYRVSLGEPDDIIIDPEIYTVSFNSAGGSAVPSQSVEEGSLATEPTPPTRTGYSFAGWRLNGVPYNFASPVTGDITLVAAWNINTYTVNFDSAGGSAVASQTVEHGALATQPTPPTRTGYSFAGWRLSGVPYVFTTPVTSSFTLTATWTINTYTVSFDSAGGSAVASQTVEHGALASTPTPPTRTGYGFTGWTLAGVAYNFSTPVTGNITLIATWGINTYTVSFDSAGGSAVASQTVEHGALATQPTAPTRTGYGFSGWTLSGAAYSFATPVTGSITLVATWTINTYTVSFDSAGGSAVASQTVEHGALATQPTAPTRTGYGFSGWTLAGSAYNFATPVTGSITLVATWTINTYTVSFDSAGGSAVAPQTVEHGALATQPTAPTRTGYGFSGWTLSGSAYNFATPVTGNITLVATWTINTYTVSFDSAGGSAVASQTVEHGALATQPAAPTRTGYGFSGWTLSGSAYSFATPVTGNITLVATWTINLYTVSFDSAGGSAVASQTVEHGALATQPATPTRTGYGFTGWTLAGSAYNFATPVTGSITLTATWTINLYTVSFDSAGGSAVASQTVEHGALATQPATPTRTGYSFIGWTLSSASYSFSTPVTASITLTASWTINIYTVSFDSAGGSAVASQSIEHGSLASTPTPPTRTGYGFAGWTLGGTSYDFATPITGDITLTAVWNINIYTVSFDSAGGSAVVSQSVEHGSLATEPSSPTRIGNGFINWTLGGLPYDFATPVTGNIILLADWAINVYTVSFDSAGGSDVVAQSVEHGSLASEPTSPTRVGNGFAGWTLEGLPYDFATQVIEDITLTAAWVLNSYTVNFDSTGGSSVDSQPVDHGDQATEPIEPTRTGYTFMGWMIEESSYDFTTSVTGDITLTAIWQINSYKVNFDSTGGSKVNDQSVEYLSLATEPSNPAKAGFIFKGWLLDGKLYDFVTPVDADIILVAAWEPLPVIIPKTGDSPLLALSALVLMMLGFAMLASRVSRYGRKSLN